MIRPVFKTARKLLGRIRWSIVWDTFDVFVRDVAPSDREFAPPPGYEFAWGRPDEVRNFEFHHTDLGERDRERGARRLEAGHQLVVARAGGTAVFTMWVNPRHLNVPHYLKRRLEPTQVFIYKAYTSPDHRGRKLYQAGMRFVLADLAGRGLTELVGYAHRDKEVSRSGLDRLGFRSVGSFSGRGWVRPMAVGVSGDLRSRFPVAVPRSGCELW